jgi:hypothetical protein
MRHTPCRAAAGVLGLTLAFAAPAPAQSPAPAFSPYPLPKPVVPPLTQPPWPHEAGDAAAKELKGHLDTLGAIQSAPMPDTVSAPEKTPAWPGMNRFDVITALDLLAQAGVVVLRSADGSRRAVWIKSLRGRKKANGWYGILLNGQEIDEGALYVMYGGRELNLRQLMTWGSRIFTGSAPFAGTP